MRQVRPLPVLSFLLALAGTNAVATRSFAAEPSEGERKSAARTLYAEGVKAQDKGDYAKAAELFEAAQRNYQAPTHELHIAECYVMLGKLVEAQEAYNGLIREKLPPNAPAAFTQAQEQAKAELPGVAARVPQIKLEVTPAPSKLKNLKISLNDVPVDAAFVGVAKPINPGKYRLIVAADGYQTARGDIEVKERETSPILITLEPGGAPAVVAVPPPAPYVAGGTGATDPPEAVPVPEKREHSALLLGAHLGALIPGGKLTGDVKLQDTIATGGALGVDVGFRLFRSLYLGAVVEGASFAKGSSGATTVSSTTTEKVEGTSSLFGVVVGAMTASKSIGFYADGGAGSRTLRLKSEALGSPSYSGPEFWGSIGMSIPLGNFILIPKSTFSGGTFSGDNFGTVGDNLLPSTGKSSGEFHYFVFIGLTGMFKIELK